MAEINDHTGLLKGSSYGILLLLQPSRFLCLKKHTICWKEHTMLHTSLLQNSFMSKSEVAMKLPSHRLGLAGTLALYGMAVGEEGSNNIWMMLLDAGVDVSLLQTRGGWEGERMKLYNGAVLFTGEEGLRVSASALFVKVTRLV